jgi:hypothetical protein
MGCATIRAFPVLVHSVWPGQRTPDKCDPLSLAQIASERLVILVIQELNTFADERSTIPEEVDCTIFRILVMLVAPVEGDVRAGFKYHKRNNWDCDLDR